MGNRANVIFVDGTDISPAVYLHWNGGVESVYAFVKEMQRRNWTRLDYGAARFCQVVGEFLRGTGESITKDDGLSLGVFNGPASLDAVALDPFIEENGLFIITSDKKGELEVTQYLRNKKNKINDKTIVKLLVEAGKSYNVGYQDRPQKTYESIRQYFLKHEKLLASAKEDEAA